MTTGADPGWELTAFIDEVFRVADALTRAGDEIAATEGLTAARWLTLGAVAHEPMSVAAIARRRGMRRQSAAESVAALEKRGLVRRVADPSDARAPLVELSEDGREVLRRIRPRRVEWATRTAATLDPQGLSDARATMRSLREILARAIADPGGPARAAESGPAK